MPPRTPKKPDRPPLVRARAEARGCTACDLWKRGTQTVFGEGAPKAAIMLVGEQPGDEEDRTGRPFVGPAGRLLERALQEAGIARAAVWVTNVVKHFKWEPRGKRRIHKKPNRAEVAACRPWLDLDIALVKPRVIVCLGAIAARAIIGAGFKVTEQRGTFVPSPLAEFVMATAHPAAVLRSVDDPTRRRERRRLVADLRKAARAVSFRQR